MQPGPLVIRLFLLIALLIASLRAETPEQIYEVTGVVRARLDDGGVVIKHDEIPGFMAAMTMRFDPAEPKDTAQLKEGDLVRFRLRVTEESSVADRFVVTGKEAPADKIVSAPSARPKIPRVRPGEAAPAFSLIDETGAAVTTVSLQGRFTVVTFIFTRCPIPEFCPAISLKFAALQRALVADAALAPRVKLLSVTLDPEFDRPEILAEYGKAVGAQPAFWNFATGEKKEVEALSKAFAVFTERNGVTLDHTLCTALIGPDGRVVELWRGNGWKPEEILAAIRAVPAR
jgi:protein SCO1/2